MLFSNPLWTVVLLSIVALFAGLIACGIADYAWHKVTVLEERIKSISAKLGEDLFPSADEHNAIYFDDSNRWKS